MPPKSPRPDPYQNLRLGSAAQKPTEAAAPVPATTPAIVEPAPVPAAPRGRGRPPLAEKPVKVMYPLPLHPDGHKSIKVYAAETGTDIRDVLLRWIEEGAQRDGVKGPFRLRGGSGE